MLLRRFSYSPRRRTYCVFRVGEHLSANFWCGRVGNSPPSPGGVHLRARGIPSCHFYQILILSFDRKVVDKRPHAKGSFTSQDAAILKGLSEMVARESKSLRSPVLIQNGLLIFRLPVQHLFDQEKNLVTAKQTDFLGGKSSRVCAVRFWLPTDPFLGPPAELIHKLLVNPSQQTSLDSNPNFGADLILPTIIDVASQLVQLTGADSCAILDLRSFNSPRGSPLESLPIEKHVESPPIPPCRPALRRLKTGDEADGTRARSHAGAGA